MKTIAEIIEDFSYAEEWEDKYTYLIELGNKYANLTDEEMVDENKVPGCMSQVWLVGEQTGDIYNFRATSDASIVRGLATIISAIFSNKTAEQIENTDVEEYFDKMEILEHISPNRRNGLFSMVSVIKEKVKK